MARSMAIGPDRFVIVAGMPIRISEHIRLSDYS
jgi:hypothetical protein